MSERRGGETEGGGGGRVAETGSRRTTSARAHCPLHVRPVSADLASCESGRATCRLRRSAPLPETVTAGVQQQGSASMEPSPEAARACTATGTGRVAAACVCPAAAQHSTAQHAHMLSIDGQVHPCLEPMSRLCPLCSTPPTRRHTESL